MLLATCLRYLQSQGMHEQHALDLASKLVRAAAEQVHKDEADTANKLQNLTSEFQDTEQSVEDQVRGGSGRGMLWKYPCVSMLGWKRGTKSAIRSHPHGAVMW